MYQSLPSEHHDKSSITILASIVYLALPPVLGCSYIVSATTPDGVQTLLDGQPAVASASSAWPARMLYSAPFDATMPPLRYSITSNDLALSYYLISCVQGACPAGADKPGPPNPATMVAGLISPRSTGTFTLSLGSAGYCIDGSGQGLPCQYYLALYPPEGCNPANCAATGIVTASLMGPNSQLLEVPWSQVAGQVTSVSGSPSVEVFLSPSSSGPVDVTAVLDACGGDDGTGRPNLPTLYLCDPSISGPTGCDNPYKPGPGPTGSTASNSTVGSTYGRATLQLVQTGASVLYMSVGGSTASSSSPQVARSLGQASQTTIQQIGLGAAVTPQYSPMLSALPNAYYLVAGAISSSSSQGGVFNPPGGLTVAFVSDAGATLTWDLASAGQVGDFAGTAVRPPVTYSLYLAPGGFASCISAGSSRVGLVTSTACGLDRWQSLVSSSSGAVVMQLGQAPTGSAVMSVILSPLPPSVSGYYEVAVVAKCDVTCWAAAGIAAGTTQRAAYAVASFNTTGGGGGDTGDTSNLEKTLAYGFGGGLAVLTLGFLIGWRFCKGRCCFCCSGGNAYSKLSRGQGLLHVPTTQVTLTEEEAGELAIDLGTAGHSAAAVAATNAGGYVAPDLSHATSLTSASSQYPPPPLHLGVPRGLAAGGMASAAAAAAAPGMTGSTQPSPSLSGRGTPPLVALSTKSPALRSRIEHLKASVSGPNTPAQRAVSRLHMHTL